MTAEELLERYAAGESDFSRVDLRKGRLSGSVLRDINLSGANLSDSDLSKSTLEEASLNNADSQVEAQT